MYVLTSPLSSIILSYILSYKWSCLLFALIALIGAFCMAYLKFFGPPEMDEPGDNTRDLVMAEAPSQEMYVRPESPIHIGTRIGPPRKLSLVPPLDEDGTPRTPRSRPTTPSSPRSRTPTTPSSPRSPRTPKFPQISGEKTDEDVSTIVPVFTRVHPDKHPAVGKVRPEISRSLEVPKSEPMDVWKQSSEGVQQSEVGGPSLMVQSSEEGISGELRSKAIED